MKKILTLFAIGIMMTLCACGGQKRTAPQIEGLYTYEHAFGYQIDGNKLEVSESGTMDFYADSNALDSARQVYTALLKDGGTATYTFNYVSPSRWSRDGDNLHFAGIGDKFRMELIDMELADCDSADAMRLATTIISVIGNSIEYEYLFHIDTLSNDELRWSFTYSDGHSDTWCFERGKSSL